MPDPNANPKAKIPTIDMIQEACTKAGARLVFLPEGPDIDDTAVQFQLANGRELKVPAKALRTDKRRDVVVEELAERLQQAAAK